MFNRGIKVKAATVVHTYDPGTQEADTGESGFRPFLLKKKKKLLQ